MLLNGRMIQYGGLAVAGMGVASKVTMITGMVCIGLEGLLWAQPVVDVLSLLLAIVLYIPIYRKMIRA